MRKILIILSIALMLMLPSCMVTDGLLYDDNYVTYYYYDYYSHRPVIYMHNVPYYRYWNNGMWMNVRVPDHNIKHIKRSKQPHREYRPNFNGKRPQPQHPNRNTRNFGKRR